MLVLSRYQGEAIVIQIGGERVRIAISQVQGNRVRLGIEAPKSVQINREEIQEKIDATE